VEVLYENPDYDVQGVSYSKKHKKITSASFTSWKCERHFFDEETKQLFERIEKELGEYELAITARNKNEDVFIIRTNSDRSLGTYYIYEKIPTNLRKLLM